MLSVAESIAALLTGAECLVGSEPCELFNALGRTLSREVVATIDVPPADNSAMDGYALLHADWQGEQVALRVSQRITAGSVPRGIPHT